MPRIGYKQTKEHKEKVRRILDSRPPAFLGKHHSKETRERISKSHTGKKRVFTLEHRKNLSGEKSSQWKGGVTKETHLIRNCFEYKLWRKSVFERDRWTCVWCGYIGKDIHADHIKPFASYPEFRFAIDNGRTLRIPCHKTTQSWGNKK